MMTVTGLPSTLPPKSSTAICAAVTDPWPVDGDAGPFISVRTPILTTSSDIWANAGDDTIAAASATPSIVVLLANIPSPPITLRRVGPYCLAGSLAQPARPFAIIRWPASTQPKGGYEGKRSSLHPAPPVFPPRRYRRAYWR